MTILYAYEQTDLKSINLNYWYGDDFAEAQLNEDSEGSDFQFDYHLRTVGNDILSLYGSDFGAPNVDTGFIDTGTLNDIAQWAFDGEARYILRWVWEDWDISMSRFHDAGITPAIEDDFSLLENVMAFRDVIHLSMDDDRMHGFGGHDRMFGYGGNDVLRGDDGKDRISGGSGADEVYGGNGDDRLFGSSGKDMIYGGRHNDWLRGGEGRDVLWGEEGADEFNFRPGDDVDVIKDFSAAQGDIIDLSFFELGITTQADFNDFLSAFVTRDGKDNGDSKIDFGDGDVLIIRDVNKSDLDMDFFNF